MSVFSNVITPQGLEPLQFPTKFRSHSVSASVQTPPTEAASTEAAFTPAVTSSSGHGLVEPTSDAEVVNSLLRTTSEHNRPAPNAEGGRIAPTNASGVQLEADLDAPPPPTQVVRSETGPVQHPPASSEPTDTASRFAPSVTLARSSTDGRAVADPGAVPQAQDVPQGAGVVSGDGVPPEPPGSVRTVEPTVPSPSEPQTADAQQRQAHREARNYTDRSTQTDSNVITNATGPTDPLDPDAVSDERTTLSRFARLGVAPVKADAQATKVVGIRETPPLMVDLPLAGAVSTRPTIVLPNTTELGGVQAEELSIGLGAVEAWRYEEVARLLEDSGRTVQQTRASADASIVTPLESVSGWTGAAVRSSFAAPVLSNPEQLELPDQLVRGIRMQWRNGVGEAKLRLTPEHLGEVLVSLQVRQGSVSAVLRVDSEIVKDWIRTHQNELKASLAAQGLRLDEFVVEEDGHADQRPGRESDNPRRRPPRPSSEGRFEVRV